MRSIMGNITNQRSLRRLATRLIPGRGTTGFSFGRRVPALLVMLSVLTLVGIPSDEASAATNPDLGFDPLTQVVDEPMWFTQIPMGAAWLPNGDMLAIGQAGAVSRWNSTTNQVTTVATVPAISTGERGALDIAVDPQFATNSWYYVYYTPSPGSLVRVSRFTLGSTAETVIWSAPASAQEFHFGGSLNFGPDGRLYITIGDGFEAARSQDLTTVHGKVLRINKDGSIPANPLADGAGPNREDIWAYGLRNPWKTSFDPVTGDFWIGDVGGNNAPTAYEEVNLGVAGANYGWPNCEGPLGPPKNGASCPSGTTGPVFSYPHDSSGGCCLNRSITGGFRYRGSAFPSTLYGTYIYSDYASEEIRYMVPNATKTGALASGIMFSGKSYPIWIEQAPDGSIWYLPYAGSFRRLRYIGGGDLPPVIASATATPTRGQIPLNVQFNASASDPDGTAVTYSWNFGDGQTGTGASPSHSYTSPGRKTAVLTVTSNGVSVASDPISIDVGAPTVTIVPSQTTFRAGDVITFTGSATDVQEGTLSSAQINWTVTFNHADHEHPISTSQGSSAVLTVPTTGHQMAADTAFTATATITDASGAVGTRSITVTPITTTIQINSAVAGTTAAVDGTTQVLPFTIETVPGFQHTVAPPSSACVSGSTWTFSQWSTGGSGTLNITATNAASVVTAQYVNSGVSCGPTTTTTAPTTCSTADPPSGFSELAAPTWQSSSWGATVTFPCGTSGYRSRHVVTQANFGATALWTSSQPAGTRTVRVDVRSAVGGPVSLVAQAGGVTLASTSVVATAGWQTITLPFTQTAAGFAQFFVQAGSGTTQFEAQHFALASGNVNNTTTTSSTTTSTTVPSSTTTSTTTSTTVPSSTTTSTTTSTTVPSSTTTSTTTSTTVPSSTTSTTTSTTVPSSTSTTTTTSTTVPSSTSTTTSTTVPSSTTTSTTTSTTVPSSTTSTTTSTSTTVPSSTTTTTVAPNACSTATPPAGYTAMATPVWNQASWSATVTFPCGTTGYTARHVVTNANWGATALWANPVTAGNKTVIVDVRTTTTANVQLVVQANGTTIASLPATIGSNWTTLTLPFNQTTAGFIQVFVQATTGTTNFQAQHFAIR
jgi:glucose/arabinose dehydrogenase